MKISIGSLVLCLLINVAEAQIKTENLFKARIYKQHLVPANIAFAYASMDVEEVEYTATREKISGAEFNLIRTGLLELEQGKIVPAYDAIAPLDKDGYYGQFNSGFFPIGSNCFATFSNTLDILDSTFHKLYSVSQERINQITGKNLSWDPHGFGESIINGKYIVIGMGEMASATLEDSITYPSVTPGVTTILYPAAIVYDLIKDTVVGSFYFSDHKKEFPLSNIHLASLPDASESDPGEYDGFHINETSFDPLVADFDKQTLEILFCLRNYKDGLVLVSLFSNTVIARINSPDFAAPHGGLIKYINDSIRLIALHNNGFLNTGESQPLALETYRLNIKTKQFLKINSKAIPDYSWCQRVGQYLPWRGDYFPTLKDYTWVTVGGNFIGPPRFVNKDQALRGILYYQDSIKVMDISVKDTTFKKAPYRHTSWTTIIDQMHPIIWTSKPRVLCDSKSGKTNIKAYPVNESLIKDAKWYRDGELVGSNFISPPFSDSSIYYFTCPATYKSGIRYSEYLTGKELNDKCAVSASVKKVSPTK